MDDATQDPDSITSLMVTDPKPGDALYAVLQDSNDHSKIKPFKAWYCGPVEGTHSQHAYIIQREDGKVLVWKTVFLPIIRRGDLPEYIERHARWRQNRLANRPEIAVAVYL